MDLDLDLTVEVGGKRWELDEETALCYVGRGGTGRIRAVELKQGRRNPKTSHLVDRCISQPRIKLPHVLHLLY